ncbi:AsmA-like C-terminal region-containing protein [Hymenobacter sp. HDW8]|uniref:AsmA-like C-terminal region-containing protein n=1 Tax=Hymenobacter sp. HDW8 TaxID=2714932 RepID=UPI001409F516|nr:AsmA-like C-terminal region-containing protein [Hymenobacter sp. HDW8]QIL76411.1 hypothetical protein G7064_11460 [Hymenobacter sp. HDW8]
MIRLKKFFLYSLLGGILLLLGGILGIWLGEERIIALFVREANRHLRTPVQVGKIDLSLIDQFPRVSVTLQNVVVGGSLPQDTVALARARRLYCAFDIWDLVAGRYRIRAVTLDSATVQVRYDAQSQPNWDVFRVDSSGTSDDKPFAFDLERIVLRRVLVIYDDAARRQRHTIRAHDLRAGLSVTDELIDIQADGKARIEAIELGQDKYFRQKELTLKTLITIDRPGRRVTIQPSDLRIGPATYGVAGTVGYGGETQLDLHVEGRQTDVQSVVALLPPRLAGNLSAYRSRGEVYFRGTVRGAMSARSNPRVDVQFGCRDASFYHPEYRETVENVYLTGSFDNGNKRSLRTSTLALRKVRGTLHGRALGGNLRYHNFEDPTVQLDLRADLDVARALRFYPVAAVRTASGDARLAVRFNGNLRAFRAQPAAAAVQSSGDLTLRGVSLRLRDFGQPFTGLSGNFILRRNDVAVSDFKGRIGRSDFQLNGLFKNALGWLLLPRQQLLVEADVESRLLDFDQLLSAQLADAAQKSPPKGKKRGPQSEYEFHVAPNLALDVQASVGRVQFRRFRGRNLNGTVRLRDQVISSPTLSVAAAGGQASIRGSIDARQPDLLKVHTTMACSQLPLDSLFYVFEDFGQKFITARHLRGRLTASGESDLYFDRRLTPLTDRMEAEVRATVRDGELNNFEPLQKLSMIARRDQLRHLRFAELTNNFYIQSRTVYMPEMEIRSNVRTASIIRVTGTHTFDQQMDYHLSIPVLPGLLHRASMGGSGTTGPNLLLAIQGDENNFKVSYDRARAQANRAAATPPGSGPRPNLSDALDGSATTDPVATPATRPAEARKPFELKKPVKKPAQPQPDEYFDF